VKNFNKKIIYSARSDLASSRASTYAGAFSRRNINFHKRVGAQRTKGFGKKFIHSICRAVAIIEFLSPILSPLALAKFNKKNSSMIFITIIIESGGTAGRLSRVTFTRREKLANRSKKRKKKERNRMASAFEISPRRVTSFGRTRR